MREWFTGVITGVPSDRYNVRFDDGETTSCSRADLRVAGALDAANVHAARAVAMAVQHSGDKHVDRVARTGAQHVDVDLEALAAGAGRVALTDIYFTLSAWRCRSLAKFGTPAVRLFDAEHPSHELCEYEVEAAGDAQAVVMAALVRSRDGRWRVDAFGAPSRGNANDYGPLRAAIAPLQRERAKAMVISSRQRNEVERIAALWARGRALPTLTAGAGDKRANASAALATLFDLECEDVLRRVISFL